MDVLVQRIDNRWLFFEFDAASYPYILITELNIKAQIGQILLSMEAKKH